MNRRRWFRIGLKVMHEVGSIAYGGALLACLLVNQTADRDSAAAFVQHEGFIRELLASLDDSSLRRVAGL